MSRAEHEISRYNTATPVDDGAGYNLTWFWNSNNLCDYTVTRERGMLTYLSLFSGAGIGCHGLDAEGFRCLATVEIISRRLEIQKFNAKCRHDSGYICGDMNFPSTLEKIQEEVSKSGIKSPGDLDFLIATPPCQGMSVCNHKRGDEKRRNSLVVSAINAVNRFRPKVFFFENTALFLKTLCTVESGRDIAIGDAIEESLGDKYHILARRINLKNYGCPSSRTRSLVIGVDKQLWFSPLSIFPDWVPEVTLHDVIGDLPPLTKMGEIDKDDIYHSFKPYSEHMRIWISDLREGQGAFEQTDSNKRPHRTVNGKHVENKNANGDKYRRQKWDSTPPCIHTRNDILSSQNTLHPRDDRVFSIRELMRLLSLPSDFNWTSLSANELSSWPTKEKRRFLRSHEMNIRHCLGEAVPTAVVQNIAAKMKACLQETPQFRKKPRKMTIGGSQLIEKIIKTVDRTTAGYAELESLMCVIELSNEKRNKHAAFYTPPAATFRLLQMLPDLRPKKSIRVLEPSAGIGRILHVLPHLLAEYEEVTIDAMDIDPQAIQIAKALASRISSPDKIKINYLHGNFLDYTFDNKGYDIIVGNPPFGKLPIEEYKSHVKRGLGAGSRNIFGFFLFKALSLARHVVLISPKGFLSAPDFAGLRAEINAKHTVKGICDFGETGFAGVRIETVALAIETGRQQKSGDTVKVESVPLNQRITQSARSIFDDALPYWVIYRDAMFDKMLQCLQLGVFGVFRDRQISKKHFSTSGETKIIRARNIGSIHPRMSDEEVFVRDASVFSASRFINRNDILLAPNLAIYPRACRMPKNCIADGSVAILHPINGLGRLKNEDVRFFASDDFHAFYRVARNYGTRSLNIDAKSVFFFGVRI